MPKKVNPATPNLQATKGQSTVNLNKSETQNKGTKEIATARRVKHEIIHTLYGVVERSEYWHERIGDLPGDFEGGKLRGEARGEARGKANEARAILLRQGTHRFGAPDAKVLETLNRIDSLDRLEDLTIRMLIVPSWTELLQSI